MSVNRTAEDWGRVAVSLPGWVYHQPESHKQEPRRSQRGILWVRESLPYGEWVPNPDDSATAGCLLSMLSGRVVFARPVHLEWEVRVVSDPETSVHRSLLQPTLGRACIAAAEALGRWPGVAS